MRKIMLFTTAAVISTMTANVAAQTAPVGKQLIDESWRRYRLSALEVEKAAVIIRDNGRETKKSFTRWILTDSQGEDKATIIFDEPAMDKGLGLLINRHQNRADDLWLKLPSMEKARRISVGDESKFFAGTDFTFEDTRQLTGERSDDFTYKVIGRADNNIWTVEAIPCPGVKSNYDRRELLVDQDFVTREIRFFQNDNLVKTLANQETEKQANGLWRANLIIVKNLSLKRSTELRVIERNFPESLSPRIFTTDQLTKD